MLFDDFDQKGLLFNTNFKEAEGALAAYRGDLALVPGEVGDAHGHRARRDELVRHLNEAGVGTSVYYPHPVPRLAYYRGVS